jgi:ABC-type glycerol-3-phosphate transport system substrate-binding protein
MILALSLLSVGCGSHTSGGFEEGVDETGEVGNGYQGDQGPEDLHNDGNGGRMAQVGVDGFVYVPQYLELPFGERESFQNYVTEGNYLYYSYSNWDDSESKVQLYRMPLTDPISSEALPVVLDGDVVISSLCIDQEGNYLIVSVHGGASGDTITQYLKKYQPDGTAVFSQDITKVLASDPYGFSVSGMVTDGEGRIYIKGYRTIWMFDPDGEFHGDLDGGEFLDSLIIDSDGKVYAAHFVKNEKLLSPIDYVKKEWEEEAVPYAYGDNVHPPVIGDNGALLLADNEGLVSFQIESGVGTRILRWLDCDIVASQVGFYTVLTDGRIIVITYSDKVGIGRKWEYLILSKTALSGLPEKEIIEIGTIKDTDAFNSTDLIVNFNRYSDAYRVTLKSYYSYADFEDEPKAREEWITSMAADLLTGDGPDIIDFSDGYVDYEVFAAAGFLEDLTPYTRQSDILQRDNLMEAVVKACTYDGKLVCLPRQFNVETVVGKTALLGDKTGWTMEDLGDLVEAHPEADVFRYATKSRILELCMTYLGESFLVWEEETCSFDSEEFKRLLALANRFPEKPHAKTSYSDDIQDSLVNGSVLLQAAVIRTLPFYMMARGQFMEPATYIGYPTADGSPGNKLTFTNGTYGISSQSQCKEGAWAFLEYALSYQDRSVQGFSILKSDFEATAARSLLPDGQTDENGQTVYWSSHAIYDNGNSVYFLDCPKPTQVDIDSLRTFIDSATYRSRTNNVILSIIMEEAAPYFAGQKTVDEVAEIIQSRALIYVSENS